jgi:hypothetical protein
MEPVPETLYFLNHLTRLMAREDYMFLNVSQNFVSGKCENM